MPLYVHLVKMTREGAGKIRDLGPEYAKVRKYNESLGGKTLCAVACFGEYDFVTVTEYPNEVAALKVEDLRESRLVVCDPAPIPLDEMERTFDWLKSWGMLEQTASPLALVNADVQAHAHIAAE